MISHILQPLGATPKFDAHMTEPLNAFVDEFKQNFFSSKLAERT